jgi:hypothetical protein
MRLTVDAAMVEARRSTTTEVPLMSTEPILVAPASGRSADSRRWWWNDASSTCAPERDLMTSTPRPLLLGYIRAQVLPNSVEVPLVEEHLAAFADRENFCLGTVYVERGRAPGAFRELLSELERDETAFGIVVPRLHHLTSAERQVVGAAEHGAGLRIVVAHVGPHLA